jgi:uncharacterized repeat protein (TIGR01451 family)
LIGRVDYSRGTLTTLVETNLTETAGVGLGTDNSFFTCPNGTNGSAVGNNATDWNCNGASTDANVSSDVNGDRACVSPGANGILNTTASGDDLTQGTQIVDGPDRTCNTAASGDDGQVRAVGNGEVANLLGANDWANIRYTLQSTGDFDDGFHDTSVRVSEMDYPLYVEAVLPDLTVSASVVPASVTTGTQLTYQLVVRNLRPEAARAVLVRQQLPTGVQLTSCTADHGGVCGQAAGAPTVSFATLAGGETAVIQIQASLACATASGETLSSAIDVQTESPEEQLDNNQTTVSISAVNPPPTLSAITASTQSLSPPNHRLVPVTLSYATTDNCGTPVCTLTVGSNEPDDGTGDGDTAPDWTIQDNKHASLRAERAGGGSGRIYTLLVSCQDSAGGTTARSTTVSVSK